MGNRKHANAYSSGAELRRRVRFDSALRDAWPAEGGAPLLPRAAAHSLRSERSPFKTCVASAGYAST